MENNPTMPVRGHSCLAVGHGHSRLAVLTPERCWALPGSVVAQTTPQAQRSPMHQSIASVLGAHNEKCQSVTADLQ